VVTPRSPSPGGDWGAADDPPALLARYGGAVTELLPWLFLSGAAPAADAAALRARRVVVVVNLAGEVVDNPPPSRGGPAYLTFALRDGNFEDIFCLFPAVCAAVEAARRAGGAALLHCWQGVSRSASCAIAYMMWAGCAPHAAAYDYVRAARPIVSPNVGFTCQLAEWGAHLGALFGRGARRPRPGPLLLHLRRLAPGCSRAGALLGAPAGDDGGGAPPVPLTHALTVCRRGEDRALLRASRDAAAAQGPLPEGEALLVVAWAAAAAVAPGGAAAAAAEELAQRRVGAGHEVRR